MTSSVRTQPILRAKDRILLEFALREMVRWAETPQDPHTRMPLMDFAFGQLIGTLLVTATCFVDGRLLVTLTDTRANDPSWMGLTEQEVSDLRQLITLVTNIYQEWNGVGHEEYSVLLDVEVDDTLIEAAYYSLVENAIQIESAVMPRGWEVS